VAIAYVIGAGTAIILLMRWLWWRMNSYGDLAAQIGGWIVSALLLFAGAFDTMMAWLMNLPSGVDFSTDPDLMGASMLFVMVAVASIAIIVSYLTPKEKDSVLQSFLLKARPFSIGWKPVIQSIEEPYKEIEGLARTLFSWLIGVGCIFALLYGVGQLLIGSSLIGIICVTLFIILFIASIKRIKADDRAEQQLDSNIN